MCVCTFWNWWLNYSLVTSSPISSCYNFVCKGNMKQWTECLKWFNLFCWGTTKYFICTFSSSFKNGILFSFTYNRFRYWEWRLEFSKSKCFLCILRKVFCSTNITLNIKRFRFLNTFSTYKYEKTASVIRPLCFRKQYWVFRSLNVSKMRERIISSIFDRLILWLK